MQLRFGILVLFACSLFLTSLFAQSAACPDSPPSPIDYSQHSKIFITGIEFQGDSPLSEAEQVKLSGEIRRRNPYFSAENSESGWVDEALEPIRYSLQQRGFFRVFVRGTPTLIRSEGRNRQYALKIAIESGPEYRLGEMRFATNDGTPLAIEETLLRQQLLLKQHDLFDISKIRRSLDAITNLYNSRGYIDAVVEPETQIHDDGGPRIDLLLKVQQGLSYRVGEIKFLGVLAENIGRQRLPQSSGDVYNPGLWEKFFKDNQSHLPPGANWSENVRGSRNTVDHTMNLTLMFPVCLKN
jgi:outer membrane protein assembly factor BamA